MLDLRAESEVLKTAPFGTVTLSQDILSLLTCDRRTARVIKLRRDTVKAIDRILFNVVRFDNFGETLLDHLSS